MFVIILCNMILFIGCEYNTEPAYYSFQIKIISSEGKVLKDFVAKSKKGNAKSILIETYIPGVKNNTLYWCDMEFNKYFYEIPDGTSVSIIRIH